VIVIEEQLSGATVLTVSYDVHSYMYYSSSVICHCRC